MPTRQTDPPPMSEAEARRRLGEAYRILLDLAARQTPQRSAGRRPDHRHDTDRERATAMTTDRRLSDKHLAMLRDESAISDDVIEARGYWTATEAAELRDLGFDPQAMPSARAGPACLWRRTAAIACT